MTQRTQPTTFKHRDSYMLMNYKCETCGVEEEIWNSRDAVSPFMVSCKNCKNGRMSHINWSTDKRYPDFPLSDGMRYFANFTPEKAKELAERNVKAYDGTQFAIKGEDRICMIKNLTKQYLEDEGSMDLLTFKADKE